MKKFSELKKSTKVMIIGGIAVVIVAGAVIGVTVYNNSKKGTTDEEPVLDLDIIDNIEDDTNDDLVVIDDNDVVSDEVA